MIRAVVTGAAGRMGSRIVALLKESEGIRLSAAVELKGHSSVGMDAGEVAGISKLQIPIVEDLSMVIGDADVLIDFTIPSASLANLKIASKNKKAAVIGTTGFSKEQVAEIKELSKGIPCVLAPNMSIGVNLLFKVLADISKVLGNEYDIEIVEAHHRFKKDAPSGTALKMAQVIAESLGWSLDERAVYSRHGMIGERKKGTIGIQTVRAGDIVGEHTVTFGGMGERVEITHRAHSRDTFVRGAIRAAKWVVNKRSGLYDMMDVLGLK